MPAMIAAIQAVKSAGARLAAGRPLRRYALWFGLTAVVAVGIAVAVRPALAFSIADDLIYPLISFVCELVVKLLGQLLLIVVNVLIDVAQYNNFVSEAAVGNGWVIVRDVVNMFFILILLVMAFATILGVESYSIKGGNLTRLLIMAVVINFSRTICGLMIDLGQIIMLTFVSGFKEAAGGNFIEALGIADMLQGNATGTVSPSSSAVAWALAALMTAISLFIIIMMTVALLIRIIFLWLLTILSPLAFFLKAVPGGSASKFYAQWWSKFTSNVVVGPMYAFFLWLALVSVQQNTLGASFVVNSTGESMGQDTQSSVFNLKGIQGFIISCCLLVGGYMMAQEVGGQTTGLAKSLTQRAQGLAKGAARATYRGTGMKAAVDYGRQRAGAAVRGGIGLAETKTGRFLARLAAPGSATKAQAYRARAAELRQKGDIKGADKLEEKAKAVASTRQNFFARNAARLNPVAAISAGLQYRGQKDQAAGRQYKMEKMNEARKEVAQGKTPDVVRDALNAGNNLSSDNARKQEAQMIEAVDRAAQAPNDITPEVAKSFTQAMERLGSDAGTKAALAAAIAKQFPTRENLGDKEYKRRLEEGEMDMSKMTPQTVATMSADVARVESPRVRAKYEKQIAESPGRLKAHNEALTSAMQALPVSVPDPADKTKMIPNKERATMAASLLRTDRSNGLAAAYGVDQHGRYERDAAGQRTQKSVADQENLKNVIGQGFSADLILNIPSKVMRDEKGDLSEVASDIAANVPLTELETAAGSARGDQNETLKAILSAIQKGQVENKGVSASQIANSIALSKLAPREGKASQPEAAKAAGPAAAKAPDVNVGVNISGAAGAAPQIQIVGGGGGGSRETIKIGNVEQQAQGLSDADLDKAISKVKSDLGKATEAKAKKEAQNVLDAYVEEQKRRARFKR